MPRDRAPGYKPHRVIPYTTGLQHGLFGVVPAMWTAFVMYIAIRNHAFAVDFHNGEWPAGLRLLHGLSPYFGPNSAAILSAGAPHPAVTPMVYPALGALLCGAFALLPHTVADVAFTGIDMASIVIALRLLHVRDWRIYGAAFFWPPVVSGWQTANITLLLVLGAAMVWRFRDRPLVAGLVLAVFVSIKVILWPMGLWLLATRRYAGLAWALGTGIVVNLLAWAVLGFNEIPRYIEVLRAFERAGERRAYSITGLALQLGANRTVATTLAFVLAGCLALACVIVARKGREVEAFGLCLAAALVATPIVWLHYFALLLVPLAIARPRVGPVWVLPMVLIVCPPTSPTTWKIALALGVATVLCAASLRAPRSFAGVRAWGAKLGLA